jgi:cytochrome c oxidase cbb3-type subunit 1
MDLTVIILLSTFVLSLAALFIFVWSMSKGLFGDGTLAATEIFAPNELGTVEDPAATAAQSSGLQRAMNKPAGAHMAAADMQARARADQSTSLVVGVSLTLSVV